jgi:hypothetical protein
MTATAADFRAWLGQHAAGARELLVGFHKRGAEAARRAGN